MGNNELITPLISGVGMVSGAGLNCRESMERFYDPALRRLPVKASSRCGTTLSDPVFELTEFYRNNEDHKTHLYLQSQVHTLIICIVIPGPCSAGSHHWFKALGSPP